MSGKRKTDCVQKHHGSLPQSCECLARSHLKISRGFIFSHMVKRSEPDDTRSSLPDRIALVEKGNSKRSQVGRGCNGSSGASVYPRSHVVSSSFQGLHVDEETGMEFLGVSGITFPWHPGKEIIRRVYEEFQE